MVDPLAMLIVMLADWIVIAVAPAPPFAVPPTPWIAPEWSMIKVPPILAGAVIIPIVVPELMVYRLAVLPVQLPEVWASNRVCRLALDAAEAVKPSSLDLPNPSDISIAPEETSNKVRTAELPMFIASVPVLPSSTFTCCKDIELPADGNAMYYLLSNSLTLAESSFIASIK
jgi:hypothetical protein